MSARLMQLAMMIGLSLWSLPGQADIIKAAPDHYTLKHEMQSSLSPQDMWSRLIKPETWWHPDHSYSGDAANLSLDAQAGGLWREDWPGGSTAHGQVLYIKSGEQMRLNAPFGPLQGLGVNVVWTITITVDGEGSMVTFDEIANGTSESGLDKLAPAVDFVKGEAIKRLTAR